MKLPSNITRQLREQFGLDENVFLGGTLNSVVRRRLEATNLSELEDYFKLLQQSRQEFLAFADELLVPESWFFRDGKPFVWLTEWARTVWRRARGGEVLRILSVPCAAGQEPYSIAMTLLHEGFAPQSFHIQSGDLSQRFVDEAAKGIYRPMAFRGDAAKPYEQFFEDAGDGKKRVRDIVRKQVTFRQRNLLAPDFLMNEKPFDVIFCRNVLIYFSPCSRERAVNNLLRGLASDGVIFAGHADALGSINKDLQPSGPAGAFCFTRRVKTDTDKPAQARPKATAVRPRPARPTPRSLPVRNEATGEIIERKKPAANHAEQWAHVRKLANSGSLEEAEKLGNELIQTSPPSADSFCTLGEIYSGLRKHKEAEPLFRRAVYLNSRHVDSLFHLALLADRRGDRPGAERLRKRALAADNGTEVKA